MIEDIRQATGHGIRPICKALGVPRSSYYHAAQATPTQQAELENEAGTIRRLIQCEIERNRVRKQADDSLQVLVTA